MKRRVTIEVQNRNGVRVRVQRTKDGTWVEADCKCFGSLTRTHSTDRCPVFRGVPPVGETEKKR